MNVRLDLPEDPLHRRLCAALRPRIAADASLRRRRRKPSGFTRLLAGRTWSFVAVAMLVR